MNSNEKWTILIKNSIPELLKFKDIANFCESFAKRETQSFVSTGHPASTPGELEKITPKVADSLLPVNLKAISQIIYPGNVRFVYDLDKTENYTHRIRLSEDDLQGLSEDVDTSTSYTLELIHNEVVKEIANTFNKIIEKNGKIMIHTAISSIKIIAENTNAPYIIVRSILGYE